MTCKTSKTIVLAGCRGGYDIFDGLPYYFKIQSNGIDHQLTTVLFRIDPRTNVAWLTDGVYFPEEMAIEHRQWTLVEV